MPLKIVEWSLDPLTPPWSGPSLYLYIRDNPNSRDLPDEKRDPNKITFAAGAWDGVISHHMAAGGPEQIAQRLKPITQALENLLRISNDLNLKALYDAVVGDNIYSLADELLKHATERVPPCREEMGAIGRYFASGADQREATKFGILLLAVAGKNSDIKLLETLASHDEFTLFAAVALTRLVDDPEQCIWRLAQRVRGWGRVQLVERLDGTADPEIQNWMLREGFRNNVHDNYLAEICARSGKLHQVLHQSAIDLPLLDSAAELLDALLGGGPSAGVDDYNHAREALQGYISQLTPDKDLGLQHFLTVSMVLDFLDDDPAWEERLESGWTIQLRQHLRARCDAILRRESWLPKIEQGLHSTDHRTFYLADAVAARLGRNTWEVHFQRVRQAPFEHSWFRFLKLTDDSNIDQVLTFAADVLPLRQIASGPSDALGLGPGFAANGVLESILWELPRFPERGWLFMKAGLQSPVVRTRNAALKAVLAWPRERWPADAFAVLQKAESLEPDEGLKAKFREATKVH
ncbi:MAG TPA: hypothetical protein VJA94_01985 [Candidatus Angelobacter sp.]